MPMVNSDVDSPFLADDETVQLMAEIDKGT